MPVIDRIADLSEEITAWRHDLHAHPELQYDVHRTAGFVADKLRAFGCDEVVTGIGRTGVVGVIRGRAHGSNRAIGLRADMDALPIQEIRDLPYRSIAPGKMHACGHDGHTAMLLGAAKYLAETRDFDGRAVLIFQPAEEGGGGGEAMVQDGMMERFGVESVYGLHNVPGQPLGTFAIRPGPIMASTDRFTIWIEGRGGHAALPQAAVDTVLVGSHIVVALQSIVARNIDPLDSAVVSVCAVEAGEAFNVLPQMAELRGTMRALTPAVRDLMRERLAAIAENVAIAFGARANVDFASGYPATENHPAETDFMADVAALVVGEDRVERDVAPMMAAEDFSYMLAHRPGAYIFIGNGPSAGLHHPEYDFNDAAIPYGASLWARIIETGLPAQDQPAHERQVLGSSIQRGCDGADASSGMDPLQERPDRDLQRGAAIPDSLGTGAHFVGTLLVGSGRGADLRDAQRHRAGIRCGPCNGTGDLVAGLPLLLGRRRNLGGDEAELGDRLPDLADGTARAARRLLDRRDRCASAVAGRPLTLPQLVEVAANSSALLGRGRASRLSIRPTGRSKP